MRLFLALSALVSNILGFALLVFVGGLSLPHFFVRTLVFVVVVCVCVLLLVMVFVPSSCECSNSPAINSGTFERLGGARLCFKAELASVLVFVSQRGPRLESSCPIGVLLSRLIALCPTHRGSLEDARVGCRQIQRSVTRPRPDFRPRGCPRSTILVYSSQFVDASGTTNYY